MRHNNQARYPLVPGWSPLEEAERQLFPTTPDERLTPTQRRATVKLAKELYFQRTGVRIPE